MAHEYDVLSFGSYSEKVSEPMGTKRKYWVRRDGGNEPHDWLFKIPRAETGEDWAEKAAYELGTLISLPVARVELATLELEGEMVEGTASQSFTPGPVSLVHGNELLQTVVPGYDKEKRYRQRKHRIDAVFEALDHFELAGPLGSDGMSAAECFVGYIVFDGWIMNVDRHHENWGMLADSIDRLAPSYDHASCLGRLLADDRRTSILEGRERLTVEKFVSRSNASGAIYPVAGDKSVPPWKLVADLAKLGYRKAVMDWLERIERVTAESIQQSQSNRCLTDFRQVGYPSRPLALPPRFWRRLPNS